MKAGYKRTEVGVIPEGWEVRRLGDISAISAGGTPSRANLAYWNGDIPWISTTQIDFNTIAAADEFITEAGLKNSAAKWVAAGTLLIALYGQGKTRGKVAILGISATTNQACAAIAPMTGISASFLFQLLASKYESIRGFSNTGSQENLNSQIVKSLLLPLPPLAEQKAIAEALSDVDALIGALGRLIEKKRKIKQAAMQMLLSGQHRLPGFGGKWEVKPLSSVCWFQEGPGVRTNQFTRTGIKLLNGTNIFRGELDLDTTNRFISYNDAYGPYAHFLADDGDIVIACSGIAIERFHEKVAFVKQSHLPFCMNTSTMRFKAFPTVLASSFLYHLLCGDSFKEMVGGQATGSAQLNFGPSHVSKISLPLPPLPEQKAISQILSDMDTEISALQTRLNKTKRLKSGMMQELLTGNTRLPTKEMV